jgi:hypothetical protein
VALVAAAANSRGAGFQPATTAFEPAFAPRPAGMCGLGHQSGPDAIIFDLLHESIHKRPSSAVESQHATIPAAVHIEISVPADFNAVGFRK